MPGVVVVTTLIVLIGIAVPLLAYAGFRRAGHDGGDAAMRALLAIGFIGMPVAIVAGLVLHFAAHADAAATAVLLTGSAWLGVLLVVMLGYALVHAGEGTPL